MDELSELNQSYEAFRKELADIEEPLDSAVKHGDLGAIAEQLGIGHIQVDAESSRNWFGQAAYHFIQEIRLLRKHLDSSDPRLLADPIRCQRAIFASMRSRNPQVKGRVIETVDSIRYEQDENLGQQSEVFHTKALAAILDEKWVQVAMTLDAYEEEFQQLASATHHSNPPTPILLPTLHGFADEEGARISLGIEQGLQRASQVQEEREEGLIHRLAALYTHAIDCGLKVRVMAPAFKHVRQNIRVDTVVSNATS